MAFSFIENLKRKLVSNELIVDIREFINDFNSVVIGTRDEGNGNTDLQPARRLSNKENCDRNRC